MVTGLMSSPYTPIYSEAEEYAYDSGRMDMRHEILKDLHKLRAHYANNDLWERATTVDLIISKVVTPLAEDEERKDA
jgi:hypothetical protein